MKSLGSLKLQEQTLNNMKRAIEKYNKENMFSVSEADFRRMALELLSQLILQDKPLPLKVTS